RVIETPGTKPSLSVGWALLETSNKISGVAIFRQIVAGRPDFEASMPIVTYVNATDYYLPFDHTNSATGLALVNPLSFTTINVIVIFRAEQGSQFHLASFTLAPMSHTSFDLATRYPQSAGKRGTVEFLTSGLAMSILGLRFGGAAFTSLLPFSPF